MDPEGINPGNGLGHPARGPVGGKGHSSVVRRGEREGARELSKRQGAAESSTPEGGSYGERVAAGIWGSQD